MRQLGFMKGDILKTLRYFAFFKYPPSFEEIHTFLSQKIHETELKKELNKLIAEKKIVKKNGYYTLGEYEYIFKKYEARERISDHKIEQIGWYIKILSFFPQTKLIGLSGSVSMKNAEEDDDIDLFIITSRNRLWTARFISLLLAQIHGIRRKRSEIRAPHKVCLNLFFSISNLVIYPGKQTIYCGHEVLQMKPLVNKDFTYEKFLRANKWVKNFFPNVHIPSAPVVGSRTYYFSPVLILASILGTTLEFAFKHLQLFIIRRHQTTELITPTQLWFFPDDFEKKITL